MPAKREVIAVPEKTANIGDPVVAIASYADHPSAFIACNDDTSHFTTPDIAGIVAYRRRGRTVFVLGAHSPPNLNVDPYSTGSSKKWSRVAIWSQCKCEKTTRHCSRPAASP